MSDVPQKWSRRSIWVAVVDFYRSQVDSCRELCDSSIWMSVGAWAMFSIPGGLLAFLGLFLAYNGYSSELDATPAFHPIGFLLVVPGLVAIAWGTTMFFATLWMKRRRRGDGGDQSEVPNSP